MCIIIYNYESIYEVGWLKQIFYDYYRLLDSTQSWKNKMIQKWIAIIIVAYTLIKENNTSKCNIIKF